jgi:hypothetical protein
MQRAERNLFMVKVEGKSLIKDIPFRIVDTLPRPEGGRQRGRTTGESFCMNALVEYSLNYEAVNPDMKIPHQRDVTLGIALSDMTDAPVC